MKLLIADIRDPGQDFEAEPVVIEVIDGFVILKDDQGRELRLDRDELVEELTVVKEPCTNCDGRGYYIAWPHTTCPTCNGSGLEGDTA